MKFLRKLYFALLYLLPAVLFFSYYPLISLGSDATMNFELSLPLIFLVLFDLIAFINLLFSLQSFSSPQKSATISRDPEPYSSSDNPKSSRHKKSHVQHFPGLSDRKFFLFALFPLYATLSIFWSANSTRAVLTAGVLWLTFFAAFSVIYITPLLSPSSSLRRGLILSIFISTSAVCLFCWIQCLLDVLGTPRETTLLCPGCTYRTFGFPHPSGFAIEPQFMGNLLLAPTLLSLYFLAFDQNKVKERNVNSTKQAKTSFSKGSGVTTRNSTATLQRQALRMRLEKRQVVACALCTMLFSSTLFLTLSRGAIYAYAVALFILFIFAIIRRQKWPRLILIPVITFFISLTAQGIFSAMSPTSDTFISGTTKVIHQLSLGIIDLRPKSTDSTPVNPVENSESTPEMGASQFSDNTTTSSGSSPDSSSDSSQFDGYIPASTDTRLGLNQLALQTWLSSPYYIFFGAGLGGAGIAMSEVFPDNIYAAPNAIVQNEGISLLLELGLFGIALVLVALALAFIPGKYLKFFCLSPAETSASAPSFWQLSALPLFLSLIIAYLITLAFFSGLPNALQIYLMPPLLYLIFQPRQNHSLR